MVIHCVSAIIGLLVFALSTSANTVTLSFDANLSSGPLEGTLFSGTFSYDSFLVSPIDSEDFVPLLSFDFNLLGSQFSRFNITQGGQAIFHFGQLFNETAAFFPGSSGPPNAPLSDIAFGFGGPGVIGYIGTNNEFGNGSYVITPEPALLSGIFLCLIGVILSRRKWRTSTYPH